MKRSQAELDRDRKVIASLYLQGWIMADIAEEIGRGVNTVSKDLKEIRRNWLKDAVWDYDALQARQLAKIDVLEGEYWLAWNRSCSAVQSRLVYDNDVGDFVVEKIELEKARDGDPRFLEGVRKCIQDRCKILGVGAPDRLELTGAGGKELMIRVGGIDLEKDI